MYNFKHHDSLSTISQEFLHSEKDTRHKETVCTINLMDNIILVMRTWSPA
jgi:hypothetical protein